MDYVKRAQEVIDVEIGGMARARDSLGNAFSTAVDAILDTLSSGGKIVVTGIGKNLHIAEKISATLASTGSTSVVLNPSQAMHGDLGILAAQDTVLALSFSGESEELLRIIPPIKRQAIQLITMTGSNDSALAVASDIVIPIVVEKEACPFNMAPTTSTTATLAIGDALAMVLLEARGFKKEDYAKLHPAGAIGKTLLLRVQDIMRKDDRLASVPISATVQDALLAMTRSRSGSVCIVDDASRVKGIFTDGDLRRHVAQDIDVLRLPIQDVMTADPIAVKADQLAVDVLHLYEAHHIDDVVVVDDEHRLIGSVDIQDLPRLKIL